MARRFRERVEGAVPKDQKREHDETACHVCNVRFLAPSDAPGM